MDDPVNIVHQLRQQLQQLLDTLRYAAGFQCDFDLIAEYHEIKRKRNEEGSEEKLAVINNKLKHQKILKRIWAFDPDFNHRVYQISALIYDPECPGPSLDDWLTECEDHFYMTKF